MNGGLVTQADRGNSSCCLPLPGYPIELWQWIPGRKDVSLGNVIMWKINQHHLKEALVSQKLCGCGDMLSLGHFSPACLWWRRWAFSSRDAGVAFLPIDTQAAHPAWAFSSPCCPFFHWYLGEKVWLLPSMERKEFTGQVTDFSVKLQVKILSMCQSWRYVQQGQRHLHLAWFI